MERSWDVFFTFLDQHPNTKLDNDQWIIPPLWMAAKDVNWSVALKLLCRDSSVRLNGFPGRECVLNLALKSEFYDPDLNGCIYFLILLGAKVEFYGVLADSNGVELIENFFEKIMSKRIWKEEIDNPYEYAPSESLKSSFAKKKKQYEECLSKYHNIKDSIEEHFQDVSEALKNSEGNVQLALNMLVERLPALGQIPEQFLIDKWNAFTTTGTVVAV